MDSGEPRVRCCFPKSHNRRPWNVDDVRKYESHWAAGTRERVWLHVLLYTGFRLGDACTVGWQHAKENWISIRFSGHADKLPRQ